MQTVIISNTQVNNVSMAGNAQHMTSLEIAELTGKQHYHVMEAIRKMEPAWEKVNASKFRLVEYRDNNATLYGDRRMRYSLLWLRTCGGRGSDTLTTSCTRLR